MNLNLYQVDMITDLDEQVSVCVNAYDESEALAIGITMQENGEQMNTVKRIYDENIRESVHHLW